ncbi:hypothetical protein PR048_002667 [Dryococelus australis]|uniref:Uncharacterized protein n=1 Tax=Dryococelus australis TaxID=614101 RepID=A0ABQ9ILW9_9NEOP|nr:hypothetical protein PR048_002667 [Dryococelus australis]
MTLLILSASSCRDPPDSGRVKSRRRDHGPVVLNAGVSLIPPEQDGRRPHLIYCTTPPSLMTFLGQGAGLARRGCTIPGAERRLPAPANMACTTALSCSCVVMLNTRQVKTAHQCEFYSEQQRKALLELHSSMVYKVTFNKATQGLWTTTGDGGARLEQRGSRPQPRAHGSRPHTPVIANPVSPRLVAFYALPLVPPHRLCMRQRLQLVDTHPHSFPLQISSRRLFEGRFCQFSPHVFTLLSRTLQGSKIPDQWILASQKQSSGTHNTPYDRVKLCRERKINIKASKRVYDDREVHNRRCSLYQDPCACDEDAARVIHDCNSTSDSITKVLHQQSYQCMQIVYVVVVQLYEWCSNGKRCLLPAKLRTGQNDIPCLPMRVIEVNMERRRNAGGGGGGNGGSPRKPADQRHRPAQFPNCECPVTRSGIEPGSPWRFSQEEASGGLMRLYGRCSTARPDGTDFKGRYRRLGGVLWSGGGPFITAPIQPDSRAAVQSKKQFVRARPGNIAFGGCDVNCHDGITRRGRSDARKPLPANEPVAVQFLDDLRKLIGTTNREKRRSASTGDFERPYLVSRSRHPDLEFSKITPGECYDIFCASRLRAPPRLATADFNWISPGAAWRWRCQEPTRFLGSTTPTSIGARRERIASIYLAPVPVRNNAPAPDFQRFKDVAAQTCFTSPDGSLPSLQQAYHSQAPSFTISQARAAPVYNTPSKLLCLLEECTKGHLSFLLWGAAVLHPHTWSSDTQMRGGVLRTGMRFGEELRWRKPARSLRVAPDQGQPPPPLTSAKNCPCPRSPPMQSSFSSFPKLQAKHPGINPTLRPLQLQASTATPGVHCNFNTHHHDLQGTSSLHQLATDKMHQGHCCDNCDSECVETLIAILAYVKAKALLSLDCSQHKEFIIYFAGHGIKIVYRFLDEHLQADEDIVSYLPCDDSPYGMPAFANVGNVQHMWRDCMSHRLEQLLEARIIPDVVMGDSGVVMARVFNPTNVYEVLQIGHRRVFFKPHDGILKVHACNDIQHWCYTFDNNLGIRFGEGIACNDCAVRYIRPDSDLPTILEDLMIVSLREEIEEQHGNAVITYQLTRPHQGITVRWKETCDWDIHNFLFEHIGLVFPSIPLCGGSEVARDCNQPANKHWLLCLRLEFYYTLGPAYGLLWWGEGDKLPGRSAVTSGKSIQARKLQEGATVISVKPSLELRCICDTGPLYEGPLSGPHKVPSNGHG